MRSFLLIGILVLLAALGLGLAMDLPIVTRVEEVTRLLLPGNADASESVPQTALREEGARAGELAMAETADPAAPKSRQVGEDEPTEQSPSDVPIEAADPGAESASSASTDGSSQKCRPQRCRPRKCRLQNLRGRMSCHRFGRR